MKPMLTPTYAKLVVKKLNNTGRSSILTHSTKKIHGICESYEPVLP
jgi:hypothetical protein